MKNLLVAQSGGPSAAINATLVGVVEKGLVDRNIDKIYGAKNGIMGLIRGNLIELNDKLADPATLQLLCQTPSSALGSCRMKLSDFEESTFEYEKIIQMFRKYNIGYFVYIGGNDSMDTVHKISQYCKRMHIDDIKIIGAPKTIDNDLVETDHCPGFGSAAKYVAATMSEISCDCNVYAQPSVTIVEIMGRDAGWLTASSVLAQYLTGAGPDLVYLPEKVFDEEGFIKDVNKKLQNPDKPYVVVAISEGIKFADGSYVGEKKTGSYDDPFGHTMLAGAGKVLEALVNEKIGGKCRSVELNVLQRCASHVASKCDIEESRRIGESGVRHALKGETGKMMCFRRLKNSDVYRVEIYPEDVRNIA
ncbi:MAG: diphosphate--fructose-6-phosphate 1-phosphotransferase, partial [Anaerotignum sp.]|nr:diphosphate--fructose-6-phosphate 1-phosphotransferase [Anaerotignum sp.]